MLALFLALVLAGGISGERARDTAASLAALSPRPAGSAAERRAARLVEGRVRALGYRVAVQRFPLPGGGSSQNVVALSPGAPRVVLVAHLDGVRGGPAANDNGSGVGVLLELARALRGVPGVRLAALGAEERVVTGSPIHLGSQRLLRGIRRSTVRLAVSLDMLGVGTALHVRGIEAAPNRSARLLLRFGGSYLRDRGESDHAELTRAGMPAAWVEWRVDRCWHRACDAASRLDARRLAAAGRLVLAAARAALE